MKMPPSLNAFLKTMLILSITGGCSGSPARAPEDTPYGIAECPDRPNCVSTKAADERHKIEPYRLKSDFAANWRRVEELVATIPRTVIVLATDTYLHAECRSRIFRFVDDLELSLNLSDGVISIRSASRTGYSDLGVNRRRVESLRRKLISEGIIENHV